MEYIEASSFVEFELEREASRSSWSEGGVGNGQAGAGVPGHCDAGGAPVAAPRRPRCPPRGRRIAGLHLVKSPIVGTFYRSSAPASARSSRSPIV